MSFTSSLPRPSLLGALLVWLNQTLTIRRARRFARSRGFYLIERCARPYQDTTGQHRWAIGQDGSMGRFGPGYPNQGDAWLAAAIFAAEQDNA